jgi:hypothetical protein
MIEDLKRYLGIVCVHKLSTLCARMRNQHTSLAEGILAQQIVFAWGAPVRRGPAARDAPVVTVSWGFTQLGRTAPNDTSEAADLKSATVELHITCQRALQWLLSAKWVKLHVQKQFVDPSTG